MDIAERFARNLVEQRERKGFDPEKLATLAAVPLPQLSSLERGAEQPEMETMIKLGAALGISIGALIEGLAWDPVDGFRVDESR